MNLITDCVQDVMQVCRNGHVITDLLHAFPERALSHCDRCGAVTMERCLTCGEEIPGSIFVAECPPVGNRQPPHYCSGCGAAFPWTKQPPAAHAPGPLPALERLLGRVPLVVRQLRDRHGERPPFRVDDARDLEDLLRALLPLQFDDIRPEQRTPSYATYARTDLLLSPSGIAVVAKRASPVFRESQLTEQLREDVRYYEQMRRCRTLVVFVYDPEGLLFDPRRLETAWSALGDELRVRSVIAS